MMEVSGSQNVSELAVVRIADGWSLMSHGRRWGTFRYRVDAEEAGLRLLKIGALSGHPILLLVQNSVGELRPLDDI